MPRRRLENRNIRQITQSGSGSYAVTIPIEIIRELGWRERQKVVVKRRGRGILIVDWS